MITGVMRQTTKSMISTVINEGLNTVAMGPATCIHATTQPVDYQASHQFGVIFRKFRRLGAPKIFWRHPSVPFRPPSDEAIAPPPQFNCCRCIPLSVPVLGRHYPFHFSPRLDRIYTEDLVLSRAPLNVWLKWRRSSSLFQMINYGAPLKSIFFGASSQRDRLQLRHEKRKQDLPCPAQIDAMVPNVMCFLLRINLVCCRALFDLETQTAEREAKLYDVFPRLGIEEAWLAQRRYIAHVVWLRDHC